MPLDLKELDTGHCVLYVVQLTIWTRDNTSRLIKQFTPDEASAREIHDYLTTYYGQHTCMAFLAEVDFGKEICVFDGRTLHSLSGRQYNVDRVQRSLERHKRFGAPEPGTWILAMFGERRRQRRPKWQRCLIDLCGLCLFIDKSIDVPWN